MIRLEFGCGPMRCSNPIPLPGHKDTERGYTYCRKMLNKRAQDGTPCHDGPCSPYERCVSSALPCEPEAK